MALPQRAAVSCLHCGNPLLPGETTQFCCRGCEAVYGLLRDEGLARYYDLRGTRGAPVPTRGAVARDLKWLESLEAHVAAGTGAARVELDVQGLQCAACVWLVEKLFARQPGALRVTVNPALGKLEMLVEADFPLRAFVLDVEQFGYLFGPAIKGEAPRSSALVGRIGLSVAIALNSMLFGIPIYLGLRTGPVHTVFRSLVLALAVAGLAVGGQVFIRSAWQALRRRVLHLDLPIAIGLVFAFGGSLWSFLAGRDGGTYFDTLNVFIALMLVGRWLQERVLERNRMALLASDGADGLLTRKVDAGRVAVVPCREIRAGDVLLVAPGDLVPVDGALETASASCSLDWITGESAAKEFRAGQTVPAGAFNLGLSAVTLRAQSAFADSPLVGLLRASARGGDAARQSAWWQGLSRTYVALVLGAAAGAFALWVLRTGDLHRALEVTTAVLVVTCPCAFGIATPVAYELVQAGLRRAGLFVRSAGFLDRAQQVRRVVFDKTGTLTTGVLSLADRRELDALSSEALAALYNMAVRSTHPKSAAVRGALDGTAVAFDPDARVEELAGRGVELHARGCTYRLGAPAWAAPGDARAAEADLVLSADGALLARLPTREVLRPDARREIDALAAAGHEVWILSGDEPEKVAAMADELGLPRARALGAQSPQDKADWLKAHDAGDTLMIGDGINDGFAVEQAFCSGTPAVDRPFMPARSDFYFISAGLRPVTLALRAAHRLAQINRRNLTAALVYNAAAVGLAYAGLMDPILCAIVMPASSLSVLLATVASLSARSPLWKS